MTAKLSVLLTLAGALPLWCGELVTLASGSQIRVDRVVLEANIARLVTGGGHMEIPRATITGIETFEDPPLPAPPPAAVVAAPAPAPAPIEPQPVEPPKSPEQLIAEAADRYGLPVALVRSVAKTESNIRQDAISPKGAIGVMQLMPFTAARFQADPYDLAQNVDAGARYLRDLLVRYDGSAHKALAAYNAGEQAVDRYQGIPPYQETQVYVWRVLSSYLKASGGASAK